MKDQDLITKMRKLADSSPRSEELRKKADDLEGAIKNGSVMAVLGAWARARRLWCEITGESLV